MINFNLPQLITIHSNWVKVQVAFYDFIMETALDKDEPNHLDILEFASGGISYDELIARCFDFFETPEVAWKLFLVNQGVTD